MAPDTNRRSSPPPTTRRRGKALETAILKAAWESLIDVGYAGLTLEAVATRAQTSRTVLSRRWSNRTELARAAVRHQIETHPLEIPECGNLRQELILFLRSFINRAAPMLLVTTGQMAEYYRQEHSSPADLRNAVLEDSRDLDIILNRAAERGEIDKARLTPRISSLPIDLLRNELMITFSAPPDETICEIVDEIFLPLVTPAP